MINRAIHWFIRSVNSHPLTLGTALVGGASLTGYLFCCVVLSEDTHSITPTEEMTLQEARLRAMVQDAQNSTFQEKLETIRVAQERFMLPEHHPARQKELTKFESKIDRTSREILQNHQQKQKEERDDPNKMWKG